MGYSINVLTLFAMVLAIGLLVDDAIVVVENVQRIMDEEGLSPKDATIKSMTEITGALVGIGTVLSAVLLPMAFFGGWTDAIYRQFSVTIVSAIVLSVTVALILTPALCATFLKPAAKNADDTSRKPKNENLLTRFFGAFNRMFDRKVERYDRALRWIIAAPYRREPHLSGARSADGTVVRPAPDGFSAGRRSGRGHQSLHVASWRGSVA